MGFLRFKPPEVIEKRGPDFFEAAHPAPLTSPPNILDLVRGARHSLIGTWLDAAYQSGDDGFHVLSRPVVLVNTPASVKYVLATRNDNFERKSPQMRRALEPLLGDGLFISDGSTWQHRRPLVAELVHKSRLPVFGRIMEQVVRDTTDAWARLPQGETVDLLPMMGELTAEIIAQTVFGRNLPAGAARQVVDGFAGYQKWVDSFNLSYFLGVDNGLPLWRTRRLRKAIAKVNTVIEGVIEDHLSGRGDESSMVGLLIELKRRKQHLDLNVEALRNEAATIFMAGHETTAATLSWAFYLLSNAPWVEEKLQQELQEVLGDRPPSVEDLARLPWCRAIVDETLRLYPPVPILARQAMDADQIGDIQVAPKSLVLVVPWLLHRARDLWDEPMLFRPERFMGEARPIPYSYIPFAAGPRICAGLAFGQMESVLCLATIAHRFRIRVTEGHKVEPICRLTLRPNGGLPVTLEPV